MSSQSGGLVTETSRHMPRLCWGEVQSDRQGRVGRKVGGMVSFNCELASTL